VSLTISTAQQALLQVTPSAPLVLVHLTTYSDYTLATVETEFWWSKGMPVRYEWGGGGTVREFEDVILSLGAVTRVMQHVPNGEVADTRRSAIDITLDNSDNYEPAQTAYMPLWNTLRQKNLHYAKVEIATVLIDPNLVAPPKGGDAALPWDLTAMAGTEHHIRFRGELTAVGDVTEEAIPLQFESIEPNIDTLPDSCRISQERTVHQPQGRLGDDSGRRDHRSSDGQHRGHRRQRLVWNQLHRPDRSRAYPGRLRGRYDLED
jgi:hypothetical protein